ncbi:hypothetical protein C8R43DRAFT_1238704 [Mycena crocata]|nr:hypothetical protein C8R43DRAFT_1238704 [Mycena crocata]
MSSEHAEILATVVGNHIKAHPNHPFDRDTNSAVGMAKPRNRRQTPAELVKFKALDRHGRIVLHAHLDHVLDGLLSPRNLANPAILDTLIEAVISNLESGNANDVENPRRGDTFCAAIGVLALDEDKMKFPAWIRKCLQGILAAVAIAAEAIPIQVEGTTTETEQSVLDLLRSVAPKQLTLPLKISVEIKATNYVL